MIDLVETYRLHLTTLNYAAGTIRNHRLILRSFAAWLAAKGITDSAAVTKDTIRDWQTHLFEEINTRGHPNSVAVQNNKLNAVKSFCRFLCDEGYLVSDPAKSIAYAREPSRLPRSIMSQAEIKKLLKTPDTTSALGYRDRTILEVFYSAGIRREELLNLLLTDVDYDEGFLRINAGKGKKDRVVPLGRIACRYCENYCTAVRPLLIRNPADTHLFLSLKGTRLSKSMVWEIVKRYARKAHMQKTISPHTFRHTCATLMLRNKANIRHIQELLGHACLTSTQVYTRVSITDLKEVYAKCHPREKDKD